MDRLYGWSIDAGWHQLKYGSDRSIKPALHLVQVTASFILQMTSSGRPGAPLWLRTCLHAQVYVSAFRPLCQCPSCSMIFRLSIIIL